MKHADDQARSVLVTVAADHRDRIEQVAEAVGAAGMQVSKVYPDAGTIAGEIPAGAWHAVYAVPGVSAIDEEPLFRAL